MRKMEITLSLAALAAAAVFSVITPAQAVRWGHAGARDSALVCRDAGAQTGPALALAFAPAPPQGDTRGCCVLKSGAQSDWQYIYTTSPNCTQLARNANVSYSFYPNTDCKQLKPN